MVVCKTYRINIWYLYKNFDTLTVHSEANARRIAIVESCFGSAGVVSFELYHICL